MKFVIERVAGAHTTRFNVEGRLLRIGRGTSADLRSDNPAVAYEHAVIEADAVGYNLIDQGSITGTYVNGRAIESARLNRGDRVEIGDLRIEVQDADPSEPLVLRFVAARAVSAPPPSARRKTIAAPIGAGEISAPQIDYSRAYSLRRPFLTKTVIAGLLVIAALAVVGQVTKEENQRAFMPGGLSSAHSRVAPRCDACHTPFRVVSDQKCQDCHHQPGHGKKVRDEPSCASCHAEHRGMTMLAAIPDRRCVDCHATLDEPVTSFASSHPDFVPPADENTLRFNHHKHLRPIRDGSGQLVTLECRNCHQLVEMNGRIDPEPIRFETHCRDCHRLTFDPRLPRMEIPHGGDPGLVYGFIMASYAGDPDVMSRSPVELRRMMSTRSAVSMDQRAMLNAEQVIKTKCQHCHELTRSDSGLAVTPPDLRREWLEAAEFTHGRHRQIACEKCHPDARQSSETAEVLLPVKADCTACHGPHGTMGASSCVTCHDYHLMAGAR